MTAVANTQAAVHDSTAHASPGSPGAVESAPDDLAENMTALAQTVKRLETRPWIIACFMATIVFLKVLRVSHNDFATAGLILSSWGLSGLTSVVLLYALPGALLTAMTTAIMMVGARYHIGGKLIGPHFGIAVLVIGIASVLLPVLQVVVFGLLALTCALWLAKRRAIPRTIPSKALRWLLKRKRFRFLLGKRRSGGMPGVLIVPVFAAIFGLVPSAFYDDVWIPAERIVVEGKGHITGYVIASEGEDTVILEESGRRTTTVKTSDVGDRIRCTPASANDGASWLFGTPGDYEPCSD